MSSSLPRRAAISQAWQDAEIDAPSFTGKNGQLVARAVKCVIDPLIIRPGLRPHLATPLVTDNEVAEIHELLTSQRETLEAADQWFVLLKKLRRARKITDGNIQELYYPRAFELATQHGTPASTAEDIAGAVLDDVHDALTPSTEALREFLTQEEGVAASRLQQLWPAAPSEETSATALVNAVYDFFNGYTELWEDVIAEAGKAGQLLFTQPGFYPQMLSEWGEHKATVRVSHNLPIKPPAVDGDQEFLPLDRHLYSRCLSALRRLRSLGQELEAKDILDAEITRATANWGLHSPSAAAVFAAGVLLACDIHPFVPARDDLTTLSAHVHHSVSTQGYVMYLRREVRDGQALHPLQEKVVAQLHEFWWPYLNRLWIRLHSYDVTRTKEIDAKEAATLLEGVAYSVIQDQRNKIRHFLEET